MVKMEKNLVKWRNVEKMEKILAILEKNIVMIQLERAEGADLRV